MSYVSFQAHYETMVSHNFVIMPVRYLIVFLSYFHGAFSSDVIDDPHLTLHVQQQTKRPLHFLADTARQILREISSKDYVNQVTRYKKQ